MRRASLLTVAALGLLVSILGGTGLFAALTDTADLGPNDVNAAPLPGSAYLQLAPWDGGGCGTFEDDLTTTPFFAGSNFVPGSSAQNTVCIKNAGSQTVSLSATVVGLQDVDNGCTGDEAEAGDLNCQSGDPGELSAALYVQFYPEDCGNVPVEGPKESILDDMASTPVTIINAGLPSNTTLCWDIVVSEPTTFASSLLQRAQSDSASWTFRFTGTAIP